MMKKLLLTTLVCTAFAVAVRAEDDKKPAEKGGKRQMTEEQRTLMKDLRAKYDTNKDGKLDAEERKAISAEDKEKMNKAGLGPRKKKEKE